MEGNSMIQVYRADLERLLLFALNYAIGCELKWVAIVVDIAVREYLSELSTGIIHQMHRDLRQGISISDIAHMNFQVWIPLRTALEEECQRREILKEEMRDRHSEEYNE